MSRRNRAPDRPFLFREWLAPALGAADTKEHGHG